MQGVLQARIKQTIVDNFKALYWWKHMMERLVLRLDSSRWAPQEQCDAYI
jgi:hypothetical protein